jgi:hypothetical protein
MAASKQWKLLLAIGALTLAASACGGDDKKTPNTGGGDGDGDGDAGITNGDGDSTSTVTPLPAKTAGKQCSGDSDCGSGSCADSLAGGSLLSLISSFAGIDLSTKVDGGYCTLTCTKNADCGEGGVCFGLPPSILASVAGNDASGECRTKCSADADCTRSGYECAQFDKQAAGDALAGIGGGAGGAAGGGNAALDPSQILGFLTIENSCVPKPTATKLADGVAGKACMEDKDCGKGMCVGASASASGSCSGTCLADSDCGAGARCQKGFYGSGGQCVETCTQDSDCARADDGYTCTAVGSNKMCVPPQQQPATDAGAGDSGTNTESDAGTSDAG